MNKSLLLLLPVLLVVMISIVVCGGEESGNLFPNPLERKGRAFPFDDFLFAPPTHFFPTPHCVNS